MEHGTPPYSPDWLEQQGIGREEKARLTQSEIFLEARRLMEKVPFTTAIDRLVAKRIAEDLPQGYGTLFNLLAEQMVISSHQKPEVIIEIENRLISALSAIENNHMVVLLASGISADHNISQQLMISAMRPSSDLSRPLATEMLRPSAIKGLEMMVHDIATSNEAVRKNFQLLRIAGRKRGKIKEVLVIARQAADPTAIRDKWATKWMDQNIK